VEELEDIEMRELWRFIIFL